MPIYNNRRFSSDSLKNSQDFQCKTPKIFNKPKNHTDFWDYNPKKYANFWDYEKNISFFIFFSKTLKIRRICKAISYALQNFFSQASVYTGCGVKIFSNPTSCLLKSERILALLILRKRQRSVNVKKLQQ